MNVKSGMLESKVYTIESNWYYTIFLTYIEEGIYEGNVIVSIPSINYSYNVGNFHIGQDYWNEKLAKYVLDEDFREDIAVHLGRIFNGSPFPINFKEVGSNDK